MVEQLERRYNQLMQLEAPLRRDSESRSWARATRDIAMGWDMEVNDVTAELEVARQEFNAGALGKGEFSAGVLGKGVGPKGKLKGGIGPLFDSSGKGSTVDSRSWHGGTPMSSPRRGVTQSGHDVPLLLGRDPTQGLDQFSRSGKGGSRTESSWSWDELDEGVNQEWEEVRVEGGAAALGLEGDQEEATRCESHALPWEVVVGLPSKIDKVLPVVGRLLFLLGEHGH